MGKAKKPKKAKGKATRDEATPVQVALPVSVPDPVVPPEKEKPRRRATAESMGAKQREISVSEFFTKNRHLLGFDNPAKALLTTVKEAVDNSLDACEEAGILPELVVEITELAENRFKVAIEDNGPGIIKPQIPKIFAKLLYGSKFHRLRQSLTHDQPVLVERNGRVERIAIGDLVDPLVSKDEDVVAVKGMRVPAFDPKTLRYEWRPVSHVIRHERHNEVLEFQTQLGKRVRVTGCHSLFGYDPQSRRVTAVEARDLRVGDFIVAPRRIPGATAVDRLNLLEELDEAQLAKRWIFVYGVPTHVLARLRAKATVVHANKDGKRSRRYFRLEGIDILDDSFAQYETKRFLPAWLVKRLGLERECAGCALRTYHHGEVSETPVTWKLTKSLIRLLGFYVAEGHADKRQLGLTFGAHERTTHVAEVEATARSLGLHTTIEERDRNAVRIKIFGGATELLFPQWCGKGAKHKRVPSFVFGASEPVRQAFVDALYQGDGHRVKGRDVLMISSVSEALIADVEALWLMQGVVPARRGPIRQRGLGKGESISWKLDVHGADIAQSRVYARRAARAQDTRHAMLPAAFIAAGGERVRMSVDHIARAVGIGTGPAGTQKSLAVLGRVEAGKSYSLPALNRLTTMRVTKHLTNHLTKLGYLANDGGEYVATEKVNSFRELIAHVGSLKDSDMCFLRIERIAEVNDEHPFVYDLSVPGCENFIAGDGWLACHNSRGQQGIGISAAGLYAQLTTGKPVTIISKTGKGRPAFRIELRIDTKRNQPDVVKDETADWDVDHGTRVEMELVAAYRGGRTGVQEYLEQTVVANPHMGLEYRPPKGEPLLFPRVSDELPREPQEIKPHPHGVELGMLLNILHDSVGKTVKSVLVNDFSRVSPAVAEEICRRANVSPKKSAADIHGEEVERLHKALGEVKIMAPPTSSVVPIGEALLIEGLKRRFPAADFYVSTTRPPSVYRGNPFAVEVGLAFGGDLPGDEPAEIMRLANRVPLQYQPKACAISESVYDTNWRSYELMQPKGSLPIAPMALAVHLASVWVPFTSEAKEAVAHYDELLKEMKLAIQECGRKLGAHLRARDRALSEHKRLSIFQRYIPEVATAMGAILEMDAEGIKKSFFKALPSFVKTNEDPEGGSSPPPPPAPKEAPPKKEEKKKKGRAKAQPPPTKKKAKNPTQLSLL